MEAAQHNAAAIVHGAAAALGPPPGPAGPAVREQVEKEALDPAHAKSLAQLAKKLERKLAAYVRLSEKSSKLAADIKILDKQEYPPGMKPLRYPDTAIELTWLLEESRQADYVVPGFVIKRESTRKDALIYLHRQFERASKHILAQAADELLVAKKVEVSKEKFIEACDEIQDPSYIKDRDQQFPPALGSEALPPIHMINAALYEAEKQKLFKKSIEVCVKKWQSKKEKSEEADAAATTGATTDAVTQDPLESLLGLIDRRATAAASKVQKEHEKVDGIDQSSPEFEDMDDDDDENADEEDKTLLSAVLPQPRPSKAKNGVTQQNPDRDKDKDKDQNKKKARQPRKRKSKKQKTKDAGAAQAAVTSGKGKDGTLPKGKAKGKGKGKSEKAKAKGKGKGKAPKGKGAKAHEKAKGKGKGEAKGKGKGKGKWSSKAVSQARWSGGKNTYGSGKGYWTNGGWKLGW